MSFLFIEISFISRLVGTDSFKSGREVRRVFQGEIERGRERKEMEGDEKGEER